MGRWSAALSGGRPHCGARQPPPSRPPGAAPQDGVHYHFTTKEEFEKGIADGAFLEYARVHNNIYGTSLAAVEAVAAAGKCCVLDIDVQGARQVGGAGGRTVPAAGLGCAAACLHSLRQLLQHSGPGRWQAPRRPASPRCRSAAVGCRPSLCSSHRPAWRSWSGGCGGAAPRRRSKWRPG